MITLTEARKVIAAAEKKAEEIGQPMNIAVVDEGGNLVSHVRMDNAWIGSVDISINKAWTARAFDIPTKALAELSQSGDQFFGIHASNHGRVMIFAGGIPLKRGGIVVGAIGVSGGMGKQDQGHCHIAVERSDVDVVAAVMGRNNGGTSCPSGVQAAIICCHVSNRFCRSRW
jgi:uncharacterized protein GlcG (DUF336 family)